MSTGVLCNLVKCCQVLCKFFTEFTRASHLALSCRKLLLNYARSWGQKENYFWVTFELCEVLGTERKLLLNYFWIMRGLGDRKHRQRVRAPMGGKINATVPLTKTEGLKLFTLNRKEARLQTDFGLVWKFVHSTNNDTTAKDNSMCNIDGPRGPFGTAGAPVICTGFLPPTPTSTQLRECICRTARPPNCILKASVSFMKLHTWSIR